MCRRLIGGDFNVIPEDIDCHKPSSWEYDALFQPEPRARYRALLGIGYTDAFRSLHVGENWTFHILGLLSAGVPKQSRYTDRPLLIISNAGRSTGKLRDRQRTSGAGKALRPHAHNRHAI